MEHIWQSFYWKNAMKFMVSSAVLRRLTQTVLITSIRTPTFNNATLSFIMGI